MSDLNDLGFVTGLWEKKDKNGNSTFSGSFSGVQVMIFKNLHKDGPSNPDYKMFFSKKKRPNPDNNGPDDEGFTDCPF